MLKDFMKKKNQLKLVDDSNGLDKYVIKESLKVFEQDRLQKVINGGLIHSTSLPYLCLRQISLHRYTKTPMELKTHTTNDSIVRYIGRAMETYNRTLLINFLGKESIIGKWVCNCKEDKKELIHHYDGSITGDNTECPKCGYAPDNYQELPIILNDYQAVCNPDLSYFNKNGEIVNWELKSIKDYANNGQLSSFKELEDASDSNKQQALMQKLFLEKAGYKVAEYSIVNYTSKAHTGYKLSPFKEYKIYRDDHVDIENQNIELLNKGLVIKNMLSDGKVSKEDNYGLGFGKPINDNNICKACTMKALCKGINNVG